MAIEYEIPSLTQLRKAAKSDLSAIDGADALLPVSNLSIIGDMQAGMIMGLYGYMKAGADQLFPWSSTGAILRKWCRAFGVPIHDATFAEGPVTIAGRSGAVLDAGAALQARDGTSIITMELATIGADGTASVPCRAETAGAAGNLAAGVGLTFVTAVVGISGQAAVGAGGFSGGAAEDSDTDLQADLQARMSEPPMGGAESDYVTWALAVSGVTRAWAYPREMGAGTMTIRFMMDQVREAQQGIPQGSDAWRGHAGSGDQALVWSAVDASCPVLADLYVVAPVATPLDVTISGLSPDTADIRAQIKSALEDMMIRYAQPGGTLLYALIDAVISSGAGHYQYELLSPAASVVAAPGHIWTLGSISYV